MACRGRNDDEGEGLFTAMARLSDASLGKIALDVLGRATRGKGDAARLRQGGAQLRHRCADYLAAHRERFHDVYVQLCN